MVIIIIIIIIIIIFIIIIITIIIILNIVLYIAIINCPILIVLNDYVLGQCVSISKQCSLFLFKKNSGIYSY